MRIKLSIFDYFIANNVIVWLSHLLWIFGLNQVRFTLVVLCSIANFFIFYFAYKEILNKCQYIGALKLKVATFWIFTFWILFIGIANNLGTSDGGLLGRFVFDLSSSSFVISGIAFVGISVKDLRKLLYVYFALLVIVLIITIPEMKFEVLQKANRSMAFAGEDGERSVDGTQLSFCALSVLAAILSFTFVKDIRCKLLSIVSLIIFVFIGIYYQKRNVFVETGFIVFLLLFSGLYTTKNFFRNFLAFSFATLFLVFNLDFIENEDIIWTKSLLKTIERFDTDEAAFADRVDETAIFFNTYSPISYFSGLGFATSVPNTPGGHVMHAGFANLVLKGGYFYALFFIGIILYNLWKGLLQKKREQFLFLMMFCSYVILLLSYSPLYGWQQNTTQMGLAIFSLEFIKNLKLDSDI